MSSSSAAASPDSPPPTGCWPPALRVTVLEATERLGGKLLTGEIAGARVDLGAESMLARRPEAVELARAVGLGDRLQPPATATASVWTRDALRPMPKGHVMGVPGDPSALGGVLSAEGLARIAAGARLAPTAVGDDVAVGAYVAERLGREVVDRLVEPLLGGVYAGDAYRISMRAAVPQLFEAVRRRAARSPTASAPHPGEGGRPASRPDRSSGHRGRHRHPAGGRGRRRTGEGRRDPHRSTPCSA